MDPRKFWTACRVHDWWFHMSDDPGVYRDGRETEDYLHHLARKDPALMEIFVAWEQYNRGTGAKPDEPKLEDDNA